MTPEEYNAKRQARYECLLVAAETAERESNALSEQACAMASVIPFGQPILVGHYSEGRDRRYRSRIDDKYRKGYELHKKAQALRRRAESQAQNRAIFSDDPQAVEKLEEKIKRLEDRQAMMIQANKLVRKEDREGLAEMGFSAESITRLFTPDFCGRIGFADYATKNNNANIRRLKERVKHIETHTNDESSELTIGDVKIVDSVEDNRLQMYFPGKPDESTRTMLKSRGFHWTPSPGCWQRFRSNQAMYYAKTIAEALTKE